MTNTKALLTILTIVLILISTFSMGFALGNKFEKNKSQAYIKQYCEYNPYNLDLPTFNFTTSDNYGKP